MNKNKNIVITLICTRLPTTKASTLPPPLPLSVLYEPSNRCSTNGADCLRSVDSAFKYRGLSSCADSVLNRLLGAARGISRGFRVFGVSDYATQQDLKRTWGCDDLASLFQSFSLSRHFQGHTAAAAHGRCRTALPTPCPKLSHNTSARAHTYTH